MHYTNEEKSEVLKLVKTTSPDIEHIKSQETTVLVKGEQADMLLENYIENSEGKKIVPFKKRFVLKVTENNKESHSIYLLIRVLDDENKFIQIDMYESSQKNSETVWREVFVNDGYKKIYGCFEIPSITISDIFRGTGIKEYREEFVTYLVHVTNSILFYMEQYGEKNEYVEKKKEKLQKRKGTRNIYTLRLNKIMQQSNFMPRVNDFYSDVVENVNLNVLKCNVDKRIALIDRYMSRSKEEKIYLEEHELLIETIHENNVDGYFYLRRVSPDNEDLYQLDITAGSNDYLCSVMISLNYSDELILKVRPQKLILELKMNVAISQYVLFAKACLFYYSQNKDKCEVKEINMKLYKTHKGNDKKAQLQSRRVIYLPKKLYCYSSNTQDVNTKDKNDNSNDTKDTKKNVQRNYVKETWPVRPYPQIRTRKDGTKYEVMIYPKPRHRNKELLEESKKLFPRGTKYVI